MPWTPAQHRLFAAALHNPELRRRKGISLEFAEKAVHEGVKKMDPKHFAGALVAARQEGKKGNKKRKTSKKKKVKKGASTSGY